MMCNVRCVYSVCVAGPVSTDQVILATGGYDHTIKFWAAHTGVCTRTLQHPDSQVSQTCCKTRPVPNIYSGFILDNGNDE